MNIADNIQAFVVTYNRPDSLEFQLKSLAAQTVRPQSITVLDDGPNPDTKRVTERFSRAGIGYEKTVEAGLWGNIHEAQKRTDRKFVAILHDDDQTHPRYFELMGRALAAHPDATVCGCNSFDVPAGTKPPFDDDVGTYGYALNARDFASFFYNGDFGHFPFFIYRTETFKRMDIYKYLDYHGVYGKWGDSAFVPLAVGDGEGLMLRSRLAAYGIHEGQAVSDKKSLPDVRCWSRIEAVFHQLMGDDLKTAAGFSFAFRNYHRLRNGYRRRGIQTVTFPEYLKFAKSIGALSPHAGSIGRLCNHYTEKWFMRWYARHMAKMARSLV